jgi:K+-sensing histidine kinase KdpD
VGAVVSSKAACPVVVCRPGTDRLVRWGITAGIDGDAHSPGVLRFAVRQAALRSRPLTVVHGQPVRAAAHSGAPAGRTPHARTSTALAELRELYPDVQITEQVHAGSVADALIDLADTSDLVVVGRPDVDDVPAPDRTLIATRVLDRVHTTVAVVPDASS